jgi:hypothetical protein
LMLATEYNHGDPPPATWKKRNFPRQSRLERELLKG